MRLITLSPPVLEITYDELMDMTDPDEEMKAFMDDAVGAYVSWLSEDED